MKKYHVRSSINGKLRLVRILNRDESRSLSQSNDNKLRKKRDMSDVSIAVEESKALAQRV